MSTPRRSRGDTLDSTASSSPRNSANDPPPATSYLTPNQPPVYASFSPATLSSSSNAQPTSAAKRLSTILVHQKSPLLLATPPQVTRALAYSHPFLLPLNKLAGLVTWTTGDPWESFLLLGVFWAVVLYGDVVLRFAGPVVLVLLLIGGMYARRFSPLSSSGWRDDGGAGGGAPAKSKSKTKSKGKGSSSTDSSTVGAAKGEDPPGATASAAAGGGGHARLGSEATNTKHQKTLDEIVETLKELTSRCNILLEPLLELTDFLSTQRTATSATTRPALTRLMIRILLCTPFWAALTLPPFRVVTTRRVILCFGTIVLTWHARVVKAGRTILWRSASVRRLASLLTGLEISVPGKSAPGSKKTKAQEALEKTQLKASGSKSAGRAASSRESELTKAIRRARGANDAGVRFTFIIYENQRRWVGLGWTNSLFAYERAAWTDEHNNQVPAKDKFELPEVEEDSTMCWRWVEGSRWRVDGVPDEAVSARNGDEGNWDYDGEGGKNGWVYYDNKWQNGRRGQDGWGRWTRRRKWYRDAELVEVDSGDEETETPRAEMFENEKNLQASNTPVHGHERAPSLPPRPTEPTLAPPFTTTGFESSSMPDLSADRKRDTLQEIREEGGSAEAGDDVASVLSSSSRSTRFRMPSLRRRVTDNKSQPQQSHSDRDGSSSVTGSPRERRSRRTSDAWSEDEAAAVLGMGIGTPGSGRGGESWGVGDEIVMGLE